MLTQSKILKALLGPVLLVVCLLVLGARFLPLIVGAPSLEDAAREERGEVVLRGCISRGNDPKWVLVW